MPSDSARSRTTDSAEMSSCRKCGESDGALILVAGEWVCGGCSDEVDELLRDYHRRERTR